MSSLKKHKRPAKLEIGAIVVTQLKNIKDDNELPSPDELAKRRSIKYRNARAHDQFVDLLLATR